MGRWLAFLTCSLVSTTALAQNEFRVTYTASERCPERDAFIRAVEQRLPTWKHADGAPREVVVEIRDADDGFAGSVSVDAAARPREVAGPRCDSVVGALALVTAVSLDPAAALATQPMAEPAPPPPPPEPAPKPPPPAPVAPPPPTPTPVREPENTSPSFGFGAGGVLLFGPAPSPLYGFDAHVQLGTMSRELLLRASVARSITGTVTVGSGEARFDLTQAELAGCYLPIRSAISLWTCAVTDVGSIQAEGEPSDSLTETKSSTRLWVASGARLGFDFRLTGPLR
jgi:hypothetical protein